MKFPTVSSNFLIKFRYLNEIFEKVRLVNIFAICKSIIICPVMGLTCLHYTNSVENPLLDQWKLSLRLLFKLFTQEIAHNNYIKHVSNSLYTFQDSSTIINFYFAFSLQIIISFHLILCVESVRCRPMTFFRLVIKPFKS